jgi:subtilisin family serine protease
MLRAPLTGGFALSAFLLVLFTSPATLDSQDRHQRVLIRTPRPYTSVEQAIASHGGRVLHRFRKIDAIVAELPEAGLRQLRGSLPAGAVSKDEVVLSTPPPDLPGRASSKPRAVATLAGAPVAMDAARVQSFARAHPAAYAMNNGVTRVDTLHAAGLGGQGVTVALIDSGLRPGFPHISLDGSVVGCEDFVLDGNGCEFEANRFHGTFVAGMISANAIFTFAPDDPFRNAVLRFAPEAFVDPPAYTQIPMIGTAPQASIYMLRTSDLNNQTTTSKMLQAMERVVELREQFEAGSGGANIQVLNMSQGGPTLFAGRDLLDRMVDEILRADIVPVFAAGNNGPAPMTTISPATSLSALTVGAASFPHSDRIQAATFFFGPDLAEFYRPFDGIQTAFFSSRGPNANGRPDPDVMANGVGSFGQGDGSTDEITLAIGSSFSAPTVAGIAAVLRQAFPSAHARTIRNAIIAGANDQLISDGSSRYDQGQGLVDAAASHALLASGHVPFSFQKPFRFPHGSVAFNLEKIAGLDVRRGHVFASSGLLLPGQQHVILYEVNPGTTEVTIDITNYQQTGPGNVLFGDAILLAVRGAKTSGFSVDPFGHGEYPIFEYTTGGHFVVTDPEPGIMRISLYGANENTDTVSVDAEVSATAGSLPKASVVGDLRNGQSDTYSLTVPAGTARLEFLLRWENDWSRYPTTDLDLLVTDPAGGLNIDAATGDSPERLSITNPMAGTWTITVDGFEIHRFKENYRLTVTRDGQVVKLK